jgi:RimJ/RimL family protein N-acetyltransferase
MTDYPIRPLTIEDYEEMITLWEKAELSHRPKGRDAREEVESQLKRDDLRILGMFDGERLIGTILCSSDGRRGWINRLAVDPHYRGKGLSQKLIEACENFLRGLGLKVLAALIEDYNEASIAAFKKAGYLYGQDIMYFSKRSSWDD